MKKPILDFTPFQKKYHRLPESGRTALWTFIVEEERFSFWGTLAEAVSAASLYAHANSVEEPLFSLVDYRPMPRRVLSMRPFDN